MIDIRKISKIYIIESQSPNDILRNRTEGKALSASLDLAEIANQYFQVINDECLNHCLELICEDINSLKDKDLVAPFIHISAHGNEDGFALTSGEFIDWASFSLKVDKINELIGKIQINPEKPYIQISLMNFCFSTCKGYNAFKLQGEDKENKFSSIIGPTESVDWADSLLAFMSFYHQIFYKKQNMTKAVEIMNTTAGLDSVFKISMGYGMTIE